MAISISFPSSTFLSSPTFPSAYSPSSFISLNCFSRQKCLPISTLPTNLRIRSEAVTLPILTFEGERAGETCLDIKSARAETARAVVHRGVVTELQNKRRGTASTLTRGEVRGGGRKPYQQKKTGRARRGSQRTPLRRGGGVIFGPKPRDWSIKMNKKEKRLAITTALMSATVNTIVVQDFNDKFEQPKTKDFIAALKRWGVQPTEHSLIFSTEVSDNVRLSSRNIGTLRILTPRNLNLYDVLRADKIILTESSVEYLNRMYGLSRDIEEEEQEEEEDDDDGTSTSFTHGRRGSTLAAWRHLGTRGPNGPLAWVFMGWIMVARLPTVQPIQLPKRTRLLFKGSLSTFREGGRSI